MVNRYYPLPATDPLHRLSVRDGFIVNAERWELAHHYHRHRQNIHYQSLNEPGIVKGLGVHISEAPKEWSAKFQKQGHCLEIHSGIAIDIEGNPIVVNESIKFPFKRPDMSGTEDGEEIIVYLVVSYVDNRKLTDEEYWKVDEEPWKEREWFRFDQQINPPTPRQIELCRIKLLVKDVEVGTFELKNPEDVLYPKLNEIDLRFRPQAQARPQALVNIATTTPISDNQFFQNTNKNLGCLMQSLNVLYPSLQGNIEVKNNILEQPLHLNNVDLVYIPSWQIRNLYASRREALEEHLKRGGVILIEAQIQPENNSDSILEEIYINVEKLFGITNDSWQNWYDLSQEYPFKNKPFLFTALPLLNQIENISYSKGIVVVLGNLSSAWGGKDEEDRDLPRNDIRTAQELGINILYFAYKRRNMMSLLSANT